MSGIVTSQARHFPCFHGINVTPSGRFSSVFSKPVGSFDAGILARLIPRQIISLTALCLVTQPALFLHDKSCVPLYSIVYQTEFVCFTELGTQSQSRSDSDCSICHSETHCHDRWSEELVSSVRCCSSSKSRFLERTACSIQQFSRVFLRDGSVLLLLFDTQLDLRDVGAGKLPPRVCSHVQSILWNSMESRR